MRTKIFSGIINSGILTALSGMVLAASGQNTLILNVDSATTKIPKTLYGALMENWGRDIYTGIYVGKNSTIPNTNGMRNDIIDGMKECGMGILEFPGGCFADQYHWRDGIGPVAGRPGGDTANGMGTDEYMQLCGLIGSEPYICCNTNTDSAQVMVDWLKYINQNSSHPEWYVKYWSMGNEPWGCGGNLTVTQYADRYLQFCNALPTIAGKPLIRISANAYGYSSDWLDTIMRRCGPSMEGINGHYYSVLDWNNKGSSYNYTDLQYFQTVYAASALTYLIDNCNTLMNKYDPDKKVGLMFNEWGAWYDQIAAQGYTFCQSTVRDAIVAAMHLNTFNNNCERVQMACSAQPVNVIQALFLTNHSDPTQMVKTPVFYCYKLFKVHQNAKKIPTILHSDTFSKDTLNSHYSYPLLTASASIDSTSKIAITVSNCHLTAAQYFQIQLNGGATYKSVTGQIITAPAVTALNDFGKSEQVNIQPFADSNFTLSGNTLRVTVPSKSVILLRLDTAVMAAGGRTAQKRYGFSIATAASGAIIVDYALQRNTPIALRLCSLDGRAIARESVKTRSSGGNRIVWRPKTPGAGRGVYVLSVEADGFVKTRQVVFAK